ncbi:hypothetical protein B0H65DRAFT_40408 [Neurospora tetraspora]|uniref:Uncharacterized protein n=1 Tax=Neurospora tetraspora TaxID=94610 RepID=A0AAE0JP48_9PEZI|nr:hypothetical protein B0H65DRAFT_40408 [Neurospora tetraspora]
MLNSQHTSSIHLSWCQSVPIRPTKSSAEPVLCPTDQPTILRPDSPLVTAFSRAVYPPIKAGFSNLRVLANPKITDCDGNSEREGLSSQANYQTTLHLLLRTKDVVPSPTSIFNSRSSVLLCPSKAPGCSARQEVPEFPDRYVGVFSPGNPAGLLDSLWRLHSRLVSTWTDRCNMMRGQHNAKELPSQPAGSFASLLGRRLPSHRVFQVLKLDCAAIQCH